MGVEAIGRLVASVVMLATGYVEMSARFGSPIAMIGGMLKENCTVGEELCWSEQTKANVIGSYFYGYTAQVISVTLARKFDCFLSGYRLWLVLGIFTQFFYPTLARISVTGLMVVQAVRGSMTGVMLASNLEFLNRWLPEKHRRTFISGIGITFYIGNGTGGLWAAIFMKCLGWEYYFYFCGCLFALMLLLNLIFVEKYPEGALFSRVFGSTEIPVTTPEKDFRPAQDFSILDIFSRCYVWMFCIYVLSYNLVYYSVLSTLPFYLHDVLSADAETISYLTMSLSFVLAGSTLVFYWLSQKLESHLSWLHCRMVFVLLPMVLQMIVFLAFPYLDSFVGASFLLVLSTIASGTLFSGSVVSANFEMDPENASVIQAIFNSFAQIPGFLGPILMATLTDHAEDTREGWRRYFYIVAGSALLGLLGIVFAVWVKPSEWKNRSRVGEPYRKLKREPSPLRVMDPNSNNPNRPPIKV